MPPPPEDAGGRVHPAPGNIIANTEEPPSPQEPPPSVQGPASPEGPAEITFPSANQEAHALSKRILGKVNEHMGEQTEHTVVANAFREDGTVVVSLNERQGKVGGEEDQTAIALQELLEKASYFAGQYTYVGPKLSICRIEKFYHVSSVSYRE